jgi:hypothetical protein
MVIVGRLPDGQEPPIQRFRPGIGEKAVGYRNLVGIQEDGQFIQGISRYAIAARTQYHRPVLAQMGKVDALVKLAAARTVVIHGLADIDLECLQIPLGRGYFANDDIGKLLQLLQQRLALALRIVPAGSAEEKNDQQSQPFS